MTVKTGLTNHCRDTAIDLFSGCGGLTLGLRRAGYKVLAAVECEALAASTFKKNHPRTKLYEDDISQLSPRKIRKELGLNRGELTLLAGCPPCQGFSTLRTKNGGRQVEEPMNDLVFEFVRFAREFRPKALMMENVPGLASDERIERVKEQLAQLGYVCSVDVFNASDFGAPQRRRRMILVGLYKKSPEFASPVKRRRTVKSAIGRLGSPASSNDGLHNYKVRRSEQVQKIIESIPQDGGSRSELPNELQLECHKNFDGFKDIYGRMAWNKPAPTITGGCISPSKGRFLHPSEDRAITLREAAMLQGFPKGYKFDLSKGRYPTAQLIGNAFPPIFAQKHARSLLAQTKAKLADKDTKPR